MTFSSLKASTTADVDNTQAGDPVFAILETDTANLPGGATGILIGDRDHPEMVRAITASYLQNRDAFNPLVCEFELRRYQATSVWRQSSHVICLAWW